MTPAEISVLAHQEHHRLSRTDGPLVLAHDIAVALYTRHGVFVSTTDVCDAIRGDRGATLAVQRDRGSRTGRTAYLRPLVTSGVAA